MRPPVPLRELGEPTHGDLPGVVTMVIVLRGCQRYRRPRWRTRGRPFAMLPPGTAQALRCGTATGCVRTTGRAAAAYTRVVATWRAIRASWRASEPGRASRAPTTPPAVSAGRTERDGRSTLSLRGGRGDHGAGVERRVPTQQHGPARPDLAGHPEGSVTNDAAPRAGPADPPRNRVAAITGADRGVQIVATSGDSPRSSTG